MAPPNEPSTEFEALPDDDNHSDPSDSSEPTAGSVEFLGYWLDS